MFDKWTSGEVPEHRDFIYDKLKPFCENELGCKFTILRAEKTYDDVFHHIITRGSYQGLTRGFVWPGKCAVNRDCKIPPIQKYQKSLSGEIVSYVGIASDEPERLARLVGTNKISLLEKYSMTEAEARQLCAENDLLSPIYQYTTRNGCWFCPNASKSELQHLVYRHPELLEKLIRWEHTDNLYHRRVTRTETPSELKARLMAEASSTGISLPKIHQIGG
jgi:hypothetical protein